MRDRKLILVVDDAREIVLGISLRLRNAGHDVLTAFNGQAGLKMALKHRPDVIVLDIRMPIMDGLTMLARLREEGEAGRIPTIVLSANIAEKVRSQALELGASYFLEKPFEAATLMRAVHATLDADLALPAA